mgnify:CR=1 FL=1
MENIVTLEMIRKAREALRGVAEVTPVVTSTRLGKNLYIKSENLQKTGSIVRITTKLADKAGSLAQLLSCVAENGANILNIEHEREDTKTSVSTCVVTMTLETRDEEHIREIRRDLLSRGYYLFD